MRNNDLWDCLREAVVEVDQKSAESMRLAGLVRAPTGGLPGEPVDRSGSGDDPGLSPGFRGR